MQATASSGSWVDLQDRFQATIADADASIERVRIRTQQLYSLVALFAENGDADRAREAARRFDLTGHRVARLAWFLPIVYAGIENEGRFGPHLLQAQLRRIRAVTIEDVECIYDFDSMATSARHLARFLFERAMAEGRFDDLQIAMRLATIHLQDGHRADPAGFLELNEIALRAMGQVPAVSVEESRERLRVLRPVLEFFHDLEVTLPGIDPLVEELRDATPESFRIDPRRGVYEAEFERLSTAWRTTENPTYLDALIPICAAPRTDETPLQRAERINDLAAVLADRGVAFQSPTALEAAIAWQDMLVEETEPSDPSLTRYRANAAAYRLQLRGSTDAILARTLDEARALLPQLPPGEDPENVESLGFAYAVRATLDLYSALALNPPKGKKLLSSAREAVEMALDAPDNEDWRRPALEAVATCIRVLAAIHAGERADPQDLASVVDALAAPELSASAIDPVLVVTQRLIEIEPDCRAQVREALEANVVATRPQAGERLGRTFVALRLLVRLAILDRYVAKGPAGIMETTGLLDMLLSTASTIAAREPQRLAGSSSLREAATMHHEVSVQLAEAGWPHFAAVLCEGSAGMMAARLEYRAAAIAKGQLPDGLLEPTKAARLMAIAGGEQIALLSCEAGGEWKLVHTRPVAVIEPFESFDWLHEGAGRISALKSWLTEVAPVLDDLMGEELERLARQSRQPILCLPTGRLAAFPLSLTGWLRDDVAAPVIVPGPMVDDVLDLVSTPLPTEPQVSVVRGSVTQEGSGMIDVARDIEEIGAAGFSPRVIESAAEGAMSELGTADAIHFCGHLRPSGPDLTKLSFEDGSTISLATVRAARLPSTKVVTLVSCYSGFWPSRAAEQVEHAAGAFLEAGAGTVVACLWPAFDHVARIFTRAFYGALADAEPVRDAFAAGVEAIRTHEKEGVAVYSHPLYWAGFTLFAGSAPWWRVRALGEDRG